ncbi:MAG: glucoamylase [uncultured bacterium]|nr:MAG: glucoamylase [uncultured bacterium]
MPKSLILGNGTIFVGFDKFGQLRDFYFHYVGLENHVGPPLVHKIGIFVDGEFSWLDDPIWQVNVDCELETQAGKIRARAPELKLEIVFSDIVYNEKNILIRKVIVKNLADRARQIKLFFNQQFEIFQAHKGDTAYYDPADKTIVHYKGRRVFLVNILNSEVGITDYSIGLYGIEGREGTFKDAEDGNLEKNPIEHGFVDSVAATQVTVEAKKDSYFYYWLVVGKSIKKVKNLNAYITQRGPESIIETTKDYWNAWVNKQNFTFYGLDRSHVELFKKSLVILRAHADNTGPIIASGDSDLLQYGRDTYAYMWPRDASICALALDKVGDHGVAKRFFHVANKLITDEGYFMHKYRSDRSLGSSWHPWIKDGIPQLPIQEDETALVIWGLWQHFEHTKDLEFVESIYNSLIKKAADFMVDYRDSATGLPKPSYDLWEMKHGISTFTTCSVYGALSVAGKFAKLLGKEKAAADYYAAASKVKEGIFNYLYNQQSGLFYKMVNWEGEKLVVDETVDISSVHGLIKFRVLDIDDEVLSTVMQKTVDRLSIKTEVGGVARFDGDRYFTVGFDIPGNPWFITTLWVAQYYIKKAKSEADLQPAKEYMSWAAKYALPSGILSEQLNPYTGEQISAAPLSWSHAEYIKTVVGYLEKLEKLGVCKACYPLK